MGSAVPPDLAAFLQDGLPVGKDFPNWRKLGAPELQRQLDWPFDGIAFDIGHAFWWPAWGERPKELSEAIAVARAKVALEPPLIPILPIGICPLSRWPPAT